MPERSCKDCRWASWERTDSGKISRVVAGQCVVPITMPPLPLSITKAYGFSPEFPRCGIWSDCVLDCPTWAPKEESDNADL